MHAHAVGKLSHNRKKIAHPHVSKFHFDGIECRRRKREYQEGKKSALIRANPRRRSCREKLNAAQEPATPGPHLSCVPARLGHRRGGVMTAPSLKALVERVPRLPKPSAGSPSVGQRTLQPRSSPQFLPAPRTDTGRGRNAGHQPRPRAFLVLPPATGFRQSPVAAGPAAIIQRIGDPHVSLHTLSSTLPRSAIRKLRSPCAEAVEDRACLWNP
jgi:hypothetical protein